MTQPPGADALIRLRLAKRGPDGLVFVSTCGPLQLANHTLVVTTPGQYDWVCVKGLEVCLIVKPGVGGWAVEQLATQIKPGSLYLFDIERKVGSDVWAMPLNAWEIRQRWRYEIQATPWPQWANEEFAQRMLVAPAQQESDTW